MSYEPIVILVGAYLAYRVVMWVADRIIGTVAILTQYED